MTDGLIQAPEGRGVFPGMTVTENIEMGCYGRKFASKAEHKEKLDWVLETFPRLAERKNQVGGTLSGGEQQMLAIGRALMARPKVLLLDEPSMGLAPMVISQIFKIIAEINSQGTTVLLVEQNAQQALSRSDRAYILETGEVTRDGQRARVVGRRQHPRRVPRRRLTTASWGTSPRARGSATGRCESASPETWLRRPPRAAGETHIAQARSLRRPRPLCAKPAASECIEHVDVDWAGR